ncbi:MAG: type II toxin-antitoxin system HipA family toxin [Eubacteriales bacterium]|nr:type II toxin-antitoxin system HipA family toxin [Eubacteriales bacterium]
MTYTVMIEIGGESVKVGQISEAGFSYDPAYLRRSEAKPISVSLPLQEVPFTPQKTKNFFDGLLPEGFTRRTVAQWMHVGEDDYLSILAGLGRECLGAIRIAEDADAAPAQYQKLSLAQVQTLAAEGTTESAKLVTESHLSLTGASGKVGLYYDAANNAWYQPLGTAPSTHIVKQSHVRLRGIVVNELLCLHTAKKCGIDVPDCFILDTGGAADENILFATARYDRELTADAQIINGLPCPRRLHQEDFAQALGIPAAEKYEPESGSYLKDMFSLLKAQSANPLEDRKKLWDLTVFNCLIGNTDNHLKNASLLYDSTLSTLRLAPAYDVVSTAVYSGSTRRLSMRLGDATTLDAISEDSFRKAAHEVGIGEKLAMKQLSAMVGKFEAALNTTAEELIAQGFSNAAQLRDQILLTGGYTQIAK